MDRPDLFFEKSQTYLHLFEVKGRGLFGEAGTLEEHCELIRMDCFCDVHSVWLMFTATLIHYL